MLYEFHIAMPAFCSRVEVSAAKVLLKVFLFINFEAAFYLAFDIILFYLSSYSDTVRGNVIDQASHNLTLATRNTFGDLDQSVRPVAPLQFLQVNSPSLSCCIVG